MARNQKLLRSAIVFGLYFILLELTLYLLYRSPTFEEQHTERFFLVGVLFATGVAVWLGRRGASLIMDIIVAPIRGVGLSAVVIFVMLALAAFIFVAKYVLDAFPNSGDEIAYVQQAQTYAEGRLWADPPPLAEAFRQFRFFDMGGKWVSQYTPGWPMVLASTIVFGLPQWIVDPFVSAATLAAFFALARRQVSRESAWIGLLLLGVSPFFVLNSGSYFPHGLTTLLGIFFVFFALRYLARGEIWSAVGAGIFIGLIGLTRPQNAAIFATPFAIALAIRPDRRIGLLWVGLGGAPFLAALLAFNNAVHGHPLVASMNGRGADGIGGAVPIGAPSLQALKVSWRNIVRLYSWTSPVLLFGVVGAFVTKLWQRRVDFTDWIMPITFGVFLLYNDDGGFQYGPRYYFEAWPFALLTFLKVIDPILFGAERDARGPWISSALIASLLFEVGYLPARFEREHLVIMERQDVYTQATRAGLDNALVIIASDVGFIRPMSPVDLLRNGIHVGDQKIIYALDLGWRNSMLRSQFPGRSVYTYSNGRLEAAP
jgi:hypothetical protein